MLIYKITDAAGWRAALESGQFDGSPDDVRDGFIHLSSSAQTPGTLAKHFKGRADLIIAAVDTDRLGASLKWEVSRNGEKFPHNYGPLPVAAVQWWKRLPLDAHGSHTLPAEFI